MLTSREALVNQGCNPYALHLEPGGDIPESVDILVVADPKEALTDDEVEQIGRFIDRGGHLLLAGEPRRQELTQPLLERLGLEYVPGMLVQPKEDYGVDLVFTTFTSEAAQLEPRFRRMVELNGQTSFPTAAGLRVAENKGFNVMPLLSTPATGTWNELEAYNFLEEAPSLNPKKGEQETAYTLAYALTREVNGKEQRIIVLGDADCMSDGELGVQRNVRSGNYALVFGAYQWLVNDEYPIDVSRPALTDTRVHLSKAGYSWASLIFSWVCPILLVIGGCVLWFRRQMK